ncbi:unnamed protein product [Schistosoma margrebowiei]|uniref:Protein kinase domain-containing protein n=1 Tax=Schistosoma margrebowiei TaxID=48269 RepID=A0A3P8D9H5_9TREM|nr:unnamed protein product [Schistosoma margrebowiei]
MVGLSGVKYKPFSVDYVLLEEIGKGSFSVVHKCCHRNTNAVCSVKILKLVSTRKNFQTFVRCFILFDNPTAGLTSHNEFAFDFLKDDHKLL